MEFNDQDSEDVVIVGAGIAGLATAVALKQVGVRSVVLERSDELRTTGAALSLFPNAWIALEALGVAQKLTNIYHPFKRGYITNLENGTVQEVSFNRLFDKRNVNGARTVHRKALLETLAGELPSNAIRYSSKLSRIETRTHGDSSMPILYMEDGTIIKAKVLIGCDGIHSVVASWLGLSEPVHSGRFSVRGVAVMPHGHELNNEMHQFLHNRSRAGVTSLTDTEVYWFLTYPSTYSEEEEMRAGDPKLIQRKVLEKLANFPPMLLEYVKHSDLTTLSWAPLMLRLPWDLLFKSLSMGNVTVAGDALHPMTPDLGQGGCSTLEDAVVLARHIGNSFLKHKKIVPMQMIEALKFYVKERRWRAMALITGSYIFGRVQQGGSKWMMSFIRDNLFYRILLKRMADFINFDCGKLPYMNSIKQMDDDHNKIE
ncbi:hypothetical protein Sjap_021841 [Stephania japonica]|uniref:FAD-binding domain-containing protein n=1 Tax=Stephania japonica TaxID=461633 RepID=A0AAP0HS60_9MAGN